jgi:hypothetical protein
MGDLNDIVATVVYDSFFAPAASADWMLASWPHLFLRRRHSEAWLSLKGVTGSAFKAVNGDELPPLGEWSNFTDIVAAPDVDAQVTFATVVDHLCAEHRYVAYDH